MVIAFGVLGTIMMMTAEREREWGVLLALGMSKKRMLVISVMESLMITFLGGLSGMITGMPIVHWLSLHPVPITGEMADAYLKLGIEPVMAFSAQSAIFAAQALVVMSIALVCAVYPLYFIKRMNVAKALRH